MMLIKFLTIFLGFLALASGACMLRKTSKMADDEIMAICFFVKDLKSEMMKLPTDKAITRMVIVESRIPKLETGVFERMGTKLKMLSISHSMVEEIEDHAFRGLTDLETLIMRKNKLKAIRVAWIEDLTSLTEIDLHGNMIHDVETGVVEKTPKLTSVDIGNNKFTCFNVDNWDKLKELKRLTIGMNPLTWKCMIDVIDWRKNHPNISGDFGPTDFGLDKLFDVVRECLKTAPTDAGEEMMDTCVDTKMNEMSTK